MNVLAHLKSIENISSEEYVANAIHLLEKAAEINDDEKQKLQLEFFSEQLSLSIKDVKARRYSTSMMGMSALWLQASPALYRQIRNENFLSSPISTQMKYEIFFKQLQVNEKKR